MYNTAFIAHNILCTASQDMDLSLRYKIPYVNCASKYSVYILIYEGACFASASNLRSDWFPLFPLAIWFSKCCSRGGRTDPSLKTFSV
jgi:hypothetical protein